MSRAARPCSTPGCPNFQPCPEHVRKPWGDSRRKERLGRKRSGRREQRRARAVILRHHGVCHVCGYPGATIADHVVPLAEGGADDPSNMRPIHDKPCHRDKTAAEAARARAR